MKKNKNEEKIYVGKNEKIQGHTKPLIYYIR